MNTSAPATTARDDYLFSLALQACITCWPLFEMQHMRAATSARKAPGQGFAGDSPKVSVGAIFSRSNANC